MIDCKQYSDLDIVKLILSGDIDAYYCLVEMYKDKLLRYIMRITQIYEEEAENILQEVFIKAYKNLYSYDHSFSFSSWIYRITHNMVIDYHRTHN
ncbi:RNA polymerase sigma factor sigW (Sigma-W factor) [sediment metagenome]|uniref:RNA polymerase sigma factor sigW (Sigma-W factor) n=1 Tax=sediment metagenome TaxID=749907 RepID=D9PLV3_9ZZZZ